MRRRAAVAAIGIAVAGAGCRPNPRAQIDAVATAALTEVARTAPGQALCVQRTIAPWRPAAPGHRVDPPPPPGFASLTGPGVFRGGGGIGGRVIAGVVVAGGPRCLALEGPLIDDDRAMLAVRSGASSTNVWLRRVDADWRAVMTTASVYGR